MKKITKAVIPVAGFGTRFIPFTKAMPKEMLPIIDKPTIQFIVEEAVKSGITDILIITAAHSNKRAIEDHFDSSKSLEMQLAAKGKIDCLNQVKAISKLAQIHYIRQPEARGLGDAVLCAKTFVGDEPFAILLGDDIVVSQTPAIGQLIKSYENTGCSQVGVQRVEKNEVEKYGIVECQDDQSCSKMVDFVEKPKIANAPSDKAVLGRYVLSSKIFDYLLDQTTGAGNEVQLTDSIKRMMDSEDVYACEFSGIRYDIGDKFGYIKAIIDFSLDDPMFKKDVLNHIKGKINNH